MISAAKSSSKVVSLFVMSLSSGEVLFMLFASVDKVSTFSFPVAETNEELKKIKLRKAHEYRILLKYNLLTFNNNFIIKQLESLKHS